MTVPMKSDAPPPFPQHLQNYGKADDKYVKLVPGCHIMSEKRLGRGSYGTVYAVRRYEDKQRYALKVLDIRHPEHRKFAEWEEEVGRKIRTSRLTKYLMGIHCSSSDANQMYLLMDIMQTDLWKLMSQVYKCQPFHVLQIRNITHQLLTAVGFLNNIGVIHSDIKPENILIVSAWDQMYRIKLADFGTSLRIGTYTCAPTIQSIFYRAPEIVFGMPFDYKIDIWSIGCIMAELYLGRPFYPASDEEQLAYFITSVQGYPFNLHEGQLWSKFFTMTCDMGPDGNFDRSYFLIRDPSTIPDRRPTKIKHIPTMLLHGYTFSDANYISVLDAQFVKDLQLIMNVDPDFRCNSEEALSLAFFHMETQSINEVCCNPSRITRVLGELRPL